MTEFRLGPRNGFRGKNGNYYLERCPDCERENHAVNVASGICAWCGLDSNKLSESPFKREPISTKGGRTKLHFKEEANLNKTYCPTSATFYSLLVRLTTDWGRVTCRKCLNLKERREDGLWSQQVSSKTNERISE